MRDKIYFERQEETPSVIFTCDWCSEDSTEEPKTAHFLDNGEIMKVCNDCYYLLKNQNIVEGNFNLKQTK